MKEKREKQLIALSDSEEKRRKSEKEFEKKMELIQSLMLNQRAMEKRQKEERMKLAETLRNAKQKLVFTFINLSINCYFTFVIMIPFHL